MEQPELDDLIIEYLMLFGAGQLFDGSFVEGEKEWLVRKQVAPNNDSAPCRVTIPEMRDRFLELERNHEDRLRNAVEKRDAQFG